MTLFGEFETIAVGATASLVKTIDESDLRRFVEMTGDDNPLHVDRPFAEATPFHDIVVHGMLGASFISTVIGTKLPGPGALWLSQRMDFLLPVRLGDVLTVTCTVLRKHDRDRVIDLETSIRNQNNQVVLSGEGRVKLLESAAPPPPASPARSKVAIVTGGSGGIGEAICTSLAQAGFDVVVNYRANGERAEAIASRLSTHGVRAIALRADVSTLEGSLQLHREAVRRLGRIGVLVNNASPPILPKTLDNLEWDDIQHHMEGQLKAAFQMTKACIPEMAAAAYGRVINITSQIVDSPSASPWTAYAVAKGALATFSRSMAAELGPMGITVNCVAPGMTPTKMIADVSQKAQMIIARQTPLRRLAVPADVGGAVAYLASEAGGFVTGQTLRVNGGISMS